MCTHLSDTLAVFGLHLAVRLQVRLVAHHHDRNLHIENICQLQNTICIFRRINMYCFNRKDLQHTYRGTLLQIFDFQNLFVEVLQRNQSRFGNDTIY